MFEHGHGLVMVITWFVHRLINHFHIWNIHIDLVIFITILNYLFIQIYSGLFGTDCSYQLNSRTVFKPIDACLVYCILLFLTQQEFASGRNDWLLKESEIVLCWLRYHFNGSRKEWEYRRCKKISAFIPSIAMKWVTSKWILDNYLEGFGKIQMQQKKITFLWLTLFCLSAHFHYSQINQLW